MEKINLWEALANVADAADAVVGDSGQAGIWDRIERDARLAKNTQPALPGKSLPVWMVEVYRPMGIWETVNDETLLLRPEQLSTWFRLEQAVTARVMQGKTVPPQADIWENAGEETILLRRDKLNLWEQAGDETVLLKPARVDVFTSFKPGEMTDYRPKRIHGWALKPLRDKQDKPYYVLKNVDRGTYLRLSEEQRFLWDLLDGANTLQDLVVYYLIEYEAIDIDGMLAFLGQLQANGFLANPRVDVYQTVDTARQASSWSSRLRKAFGYLISTEFAIKGIDRFFDLVYRMGGFLFFDGMVRLVTAIVAVVGLVAFIYLRWLRPMPVLGGVNPVWYLPAFYVSVFIMVFIHELSHALTVKHYGREVRRGGIMLYMGFLAFFVDTTDIWLSPRAARLETSWNGPYSGFVFAGLCCLLVLVIPQPEVMAFLFQLALFLYTISALQFNPLLKNDGYYLLMDWLEIPCLLDRSIQFVRRELWGRIKARQPLTHEEKLFTGFGAFSLAWSTFTLGMFFMSIAAWLLKLIGL